MANPLTFCTMIISGSQLSLTPMTDPLPLVSERLASAADGVICCPSVMELGDRLRTLEIWLIEYKLLAFAAQKQDIRPPDDELEGGSYRIRESFAKFGLHEQ